ncbi:MAG: alpha/beta hydrolase [Pseudomonadaceae bacterium]
MTAAAFKREDVSFASGDSYCQAWLYVPQVGPDEITPCVVMAHGLGGTRAAGLEPFAERFVAQGYRVLVFDYRFFGGSGGEPRQLLTVTHQLTDWRAALGYARGLPGVDATGVVLWGTSFSGGHVTTLAAEQPGLAAVIAMNPMLDGLASTRMYLGYAGLLHLLRLGGSGLVDQLRAMVGRSPLLIPVVAKHGEFAALSSAEAWDGYQAIAAPGWRNQMSARFALTLALYHPLGKAHKIRCPILLQPCMRDSVVSPLAAERLAERAAHAELCRYPQMGHFSVYVGEGFEQVIRDQLCFLARVLG